MKKESKWVAKKIKGVALIVLYNKDTNHVFIKCNGNKYFSYRITDVYNSLKTISENGKINNVLSDVIKIFNNADKEVNEEFLNNRIDQMADKYDQWSRKANTAFTFLYFVMVSEQQVTSSSSKNLSLLGAYQVLTQGYDVKKAANDTKITALTPDKRESEYQKNESKINQMKEKLEENGYQLNFDYENSELTAKKNTSNIDEYDPIEAAKDYEGDIVSDTYGMSRDELSRYAEDNPAIPDDYFD